MSGPIGTHSTIDDIALATGVRLHVVEQGDNDGHPVILLHGYSDTWFSFSRVLPLLPAGIRAFAIDQRGHGRSDKPATGYAMVDLAADVTALMDAKGVATATIVGHSMGSFVAQQVALLAPERLAALVLVGSAPHVNAFNGMDELEAAVATLEDPVPLAFTREFQESTIHAPVPQAFVDRVSEDSRLVPAAAWRGLMRGLRTMPSTAALERLRIPALVVWGERDALVPRSAVNALVAQLPGATLSTFEDPAHATHWERPERFAQELEAFLGAVTRR